MIVSKETVLSNLVIATRAVVGNRLSLLPNSNIRAVKKSFQDIAVQPPYPFIDIAYELSSDNSGNSIRTKYVDEDNFVHIVSEQAYDYKIKCYGEEAVEILTELKYRLNDDEALLAFNEQVGAVLVVMDDPIFEPTFKETNFIMSAYIMATFMVLHDFTTTTTVVDSVELEGEFDRIPLTGSLTEDDIDPDPFSVTFTTDINI